VGCGADTETCSETYGDPFVKKREARKVNRQVTLGMIVMLGLRSFRMTALFAMLFTFLRVEPGLFSYIVLGGFFVVYVIMDYAVIIPQEQKFAYDKNPGLQGLEAKIDEIQNRLD
jgi:hypothetical protein